MRDVVLVHGAWHGGWCWRRVTDLVHAAGHRAHAPTLSGLADRAHLLTPAITLETHVQDIIALLEFEDVRDGVLCGHSYGGLVAALVADRVPERVAHLVLLDALMPVAGRSAMDALEDERQVPALLRSLARSHGDGWRVPTSPFTAEALGIVDPIDASWAIARLTDHPLAALEERATLTGGIEGLRRTFVRATRFAARWADHQLELARRDPGWECLTVSAGHDLNITHPREVTEIVLG